MEIFKLPEIASTINKFKNVLLRKTKKIAIKKHRIYKIIICISLQLTHVHRSLIIPKLTHCTSKKEI